METAVNTFGEGLNKDLNPTVTPNSVLTDCLNGTLITYNGNEQVLQNDMGNGRVHEDVHLEKGYVPVGMKEHGGIIYVASYNPKTLMSLLGSFPSPQRNVEDEFGDSSQGLVLPTTPGTFTLTILTKNKIHSGDSIYVWFNDIMNSVLTPTFNADGTLYDELYRKYSIYMTVMGTDGNLKDQTVNFIPLKYTVKDTDGNITTPELADYYWYALSSPTGTPNYTIYNGISGIPYLKVLFNGIIDLDLDVLLTKNISSSNKLNIQVNGDFLFNCPYKTDGFRGVKLTYYLSKGTNTDGSLIWENGTSKLLTFDSTAEATKGSDGYIISLQQTITNIDTTFTTSGKTSNARYIKYEVVPYFKYETPSGTTSEETYVVDSWMVKGLAEIAKISSGISTINTWKYRYESANDIYITWGMESYPSGVNSVDVPKEIKFIFYPIADLSTITPLYNSASGTEVYNSENIYYTKTTTNGKDTYTKTTLSNETQGKTIATKNIHSIHLNEPSTVILYAPELRSNYNGVFTENLTDLNFLAGTCYLVKISYKVNDGTNDIQNTYYRWLVTSELYNDNYYLLENDFIKITPKNTVPLINVNASVTYKESSSLSLGTSLPVLLLEPEIKSGNNYVVSTYTYNLTPKYSTSWDKNYPVEIELPSVINLKLDDKYSEELKLEREEGTGDRISFENNVLTYKYREPYKYKYLQNLISISNMFKTYSIRLDVVPKFYEAVITTYSTNKGDYNNFYLYCTIYDQDGEVVVDKFDCSSRGSHYNIGEDNPSEPYQIKQDMDLDKIFNRLDLLGMGVIGLIVTAAVYNDSSQNEKNWYGTEAELRDAYANVAYNYLVRTSNDSISFLNEHFIVTTINRSVETNDFIKEEDLHKNILNENTSLKNLVENGNRTNFTYNPYEHGKLADTITESPYKANGAFTNIAISSGPLVLSGYYPEIESQRTFDTDILEQLPLVLDLRWNNFTLKMNGNKNFTSWTNLIKNLTTNLSKFFEFLITKDTQLNITFSGLPESFEHVKFGTLKIEVADGIKTMLALIQCEETTYITPPGELDPDQVIECYKDTSGNWTFSSIDGLRRSEKSDIFPYRQALFGTSSTNLSRDIGTASRYRRKTNAVNKKFAYTGMLFRFNKNLLVSNALEVKNSLK